MNIEHSHVNVYNECVYYNGLVKKLTRELLHESALLYFKKNANIAMKRQKYEKMRQDVYLHKIYTHSFTHTQVSHFLVKMYGEKKPTTTKSERTKVIERERKLSDAIAHSTGTGCEWETYFMHSSFRKTIIQLHAVFECKINSKHLIYVCTFFKERIKSNATLTYVHSIAIMSTISCD